MNRTVARLGAVAAIVGSIIGFAGNLLHPRAPGYSIAEELRVVSQSDIWVFDHFLITLAIALSFLGLVVIAKSFDEEPAASWARVALSSATLGSALGLMTIFIDGVGSDQAAKAWAADPNPASLANASALITITLSLFTGLMFTLFGITPLLYGAAGLSSRQYPRWLGYLAIFSGVLGLLAGSIQYLAGISTLTANVLFPIGSLSFTLWTLMMGRQLWKRTSRPEEVDGGEAS